MKVSYVISYLIIAPLCSVYSAYLALPVNKVEEKSFYP